MRETRKTTTPAYQGCFCPTFVTDSALALRDTIYAAR